MGKRKSVFWGGAILILFLVSLLIYSQITAQTGTDGLTSGEFADVMLLVLGVPLPEGKTSWDDVTYLKKKQLLADYMPAMTWSTDSGEEVTTVEVAEVLTEILGFTNLRAGTHVAKLVELGLMDEDAGINANQPIILEDLVEVINNVSDAVELGAAGGGIDLPPGVSINPYTDPISPVI